MEVRGGVLLTLSSQPHISQSLCRGFCLTTCFVQWAMSTRDVCDFQPNALSSQSWRATFQLPLAVIEDRGPATKEPQDGAQPRWLGHCRKKPLLSDRTPTRLWISYDSIELTCSCSATKFILLYRGPESNLSGMTNCWIYNQVQHN